MIVTEEFLEVGRTENGGYTKKQLAAIGIDWPPCRGWRKDMIGKEISEEQAEIFLNGKTYLLVEKEAFLNDGVLRKEVSIYIQEHCDCVKTKEGRYEVLLSTKGKELLISDSFADTTNYRVIMQGAIDAIRKLKMPCKVNLYSTTPFGIKRLRFSDGTWRDSLKSSVNQDLLLQLKDEIIKGKHVVNFIVDKQCIDEKISRYKAACAEISKF